MKSILGKKWHRIPAVMLAVLLVVVLTTGAVFAAISQTQTITQVITPPPSGSSITSPDITVDSVVAGTGIMFVQVFEDAVSVTVASEDVGKTLYVRLNKDSTAWYEKYGVNVIGNPEDNPTGGIVGMMVNVNFGGVDKLEDSYGPLEEGTYLFQMSVMGTPGNVAKDAAKVKVTYSIE